jgi:RNA polymerase sigma factor (TIGR02999 family)
MVSPAISEITFALNALGLNDSRASEEILPLVYQDLRRQASAQMAREAPGQTLQPTALVHEAWLRLVGGPNQRWQNRAHFYGAAAEAMRRILIESARRKRRLKRGGDQLRVNLDAVELAEAPPEEKVLLIDEAVELLKAQDPERANVVVMKFYGGFTNEEVAASLGVTVRTIERQWAFAKAWLYQSIRATRGA